MGSERENFVRIVSGSKFEKSEVTTQPGHLYLKRGDRIRFEALHSKVVVFIPEIKHLFDGQDPIIRLDERGVSAEELVVREDARAGKYPYAVYCRSKREFAVGCSSPAMIVEV